MTDPAAEAAQRAWDDTNDWGFDYEMDGLEESAREALAPIRDLVEAVSLCEWSLNEFIDLLLPLIYTTEELNDE